MLTDLHAVSDWPRTALVNYITVGHLLASIGKTVPVPCLRGRELRHDQIARFFVLGDLACMFLQGAAGAPIAVLSQLIRRPLAGGLLASQNAGSFTSLFLLLLACSVHVVAQV